MSHLELYAVPLYGPGHGHPVMVVVQGGPVVPSPGRVDGAAVVEIPRLEVQVPQVWWEGVDVDAGLGDDGGEDEAGDGGPHPGGVGGLQTSGE